MISGEAGGPGQERPSEQIRNMLIFLVPERYSNPYLDYAAERLSDQANSDQIIETRNVQPQHEGFAGTAAVLLGPYAIATGNVDLANYIYNDIPGAKTWELYTLARTDPNHADSFDDWEPPEPTEFQNFTAEFDFNREMLAAHTKIALSAYASPDTNVVKRSNLLYQACTLRKLFINMLDDHNQPRSLSFEIDFAFAKAGLAREVFPPPIANFSPYKHNFCIKANAGRLSKFDRIVTFGLQDADAKLLLWVDDRRNGREVTPISRDEWPKMTALDYMAKLVPRMLLSANAVLPLQQQIQVCLAAGNFERARNAYRDLIATTSIYDVGNLPSIMSMAQYYQLHFIERQEQSVVDESA